MWSIPPIIIAAAAGAVVLLVIGVLLAVAFERRRYTQLLQQHARLPRMNAYHRAKLSVNENNYLNISPPKAKLRRSLQPPCDPIVGVTNISSRHQHISQDDGPSDVEAASALSSKSKRRRSLRHTLYGSSLYVPKTRRLKKIEKAVLSRDIPLSPLSAITEFTDSSVGESPVIVEKDGLEARTGTSPNFVLNTTSRSPLTWPLAIFNPHNSLECNPMDLSQNDNIRQGTQRVACRPDLGPRSFSTNSSVSDAPLDPLPPLPCKTNRLSSSLPAVGWRTSTTSIDTTGSSVLAASLSPRLQNKAYSKAASSSSRSGLESFDFGLTVTETRPRLAPPPGKQASDNYHVGGTGITSIRPSVDYHHGELPACDPKRVTIDGQPATPGSLKTIDASCWHPGPAITMRSNVRKTVRHSMYENNSSSQAHSLSIEMLRNREHQPSLKTLLQRPASVAGGISRELNSKSSSWDRRHSLCSVDPSKKGHKRQNCIRITNLPSVACYEDKGVVKMPDLNEETCENGCENSVCLPGSSLSKVQYPLSRVKEINSNKKRSEPAMQMKTVLENATKFTQPRDRTENNKTDDLSIQNIGSDVFYNESQSTAVPHIFVTSSPPRLPLSPTRSNDIKMNTQTPPAHSTQSPFSSPMLPSPLVTSAMLFPRKSMVRGPRNQPKAFQQRLITSPTPASGKGNSSANRRSPAMDLRKSIFLLRDMNSEGHLPYRNNCPYQSLEEDRSEMMEGKPTISAERVILSNPSNMQLLSHKPIRNSNDQLPILSSPSGMSISGISIWEDASVRGDSPEPDLPPFTLEQVFQRHSTKIGSIPMDSEACENRASKSIAEGLLAEARNSNSPQRQGLGLRIGSKTLGTPGSLYDRDGFLKE